MNNRATAHIREEGRKKCQQTQWRNEGTGRGKLGSPFVSAGKLKTDLKNAISATGRQTLLVRADRLMEIKQRELLSFLFLLLQSS